MRDNSKKKKKRGNILFKNFGTCNVVIKKINKDLRIDAIKKNCII